MTLATLAPLRLALQAENSPALILVLGDVSHIDSAGLGLLVQLHASCQRTGRRMALAGVNERIRTSLDVMGLSQVLTLYSTREDAERALA
jgi:anti-anti-sigma factor